MFRRIGFWLAGVCAIIFAVYFFSKEQFTNKEPSVVERILSTITYPVKFVVLSMNDFIFTVSHIYNNLKMTGHETTSIQNENIELKVKMKALNDLVTENNRLRDLLSLSQRLSLKFISADVVNSDPSFLYQNIQIDKGRKNNIQIGMGVLNEDGVAGIVMHVTDYFSDVILLTDPNSSFDAMITRNKKRGVLHGGILNKMQFKYFDNSSNIIVGDDIVTSGITGSFPSGIPIGKISKVESSDGGMSQFVEVTPAVNVSNLSNVLVLLNSNKEIELIKKIEGEEWMDKNLGTKVEK